MTQDIIEKIRTKQKLAQIPLTLDPPQHKPEMLYIGCIDARLDPVADIGIPQGKALIYRNIGALVRPSVAGGKSDGNVSVTGEEIPESVSIGAALEFFIKHIPANGKKKHIVVSGHTDCGGIRACRHDLAEKGGYLQRYLSALGDALKTVLGMGHKSEQEELRALEQESVRHSIANLMTYDVVKKAVEAGQVELHGWVINTATQRIDELDEKGQFVPFVNRSPGMSR